MTNISQLNSTDSISDGDQFAIFVTSNGDTRKVAASVLKAYIDPNNSGYVSQYFSPTTTFNVSISPDDGSNVHLILTPTGTLATGAITLPLTVIDGQRLLVNTTQEITTLTIIGGAASVVGAPSTLAVNDFFTLKYDAPTQTWYRVG